MDWPSLANASVNASISVLTRLSGCGVELWTASFAQVVLGTLRLSARGESHLNEALAKLHSFGSSGNLIYFGFGVKHIVRTLADSFEGMATVALCSALAEVHSLRISTQIIQEYVKLYSTGAEGNLIPSYRQWEALVNSCSGILAQSTFGPVVEFFMQFHPQGKVAGDPVQVARGLEGLAKISSGLMKSMVLMGGSECGFLAAIAQWLLDLNVVVQNAAGDTVYPSTGATGNYQLMVIYTENTENTEGSRSLCRTEDTYYINDFEDIFHRGFLSGEGSRREDLSGRVEWATALRQTFGDSANQLLQVPSVLGEIIGSAAKVFTFTYESTKLKDLPSNPKFTRAGQEVSGQGFIDLACRLLPELAASKSAMDMAVERPLYDAFKHFEKARSILKEMCSCWHCAPCPVRTRGTSRGNDTHCLLLLANTVIQLVRQIATVASMPADLRPSRRGLESLCEEVGKKPRYGQQREGNDILLDVFERTDLLELAELIFVVTPSHEFGRSGPDHQGSRPTATVKGGVCFVLDSLIRLSDRPEETLRVHIIPGHIDWNGKLFARIQDGKIGPPMSIMPPLLLPAPQAEVTAQIQLVQGMTARAVVTEFSDFLRMSYELKSASGTFFIGPSAHGKQIVKASGKVFCSGKACRSFAGLHDAFLLTLYSTRVPPGNYSHSRGGHIDVAEKPNILLLGQNRLARCSALAVDDFHTDKILQGGECIGCCARRALRSGHPQSYVIISHLTVENMEEVIGHRNALISDS